MTPNRKTTYWFDMDGCIACYDRDGYIAPEQGPAPYQDTTQHYFLERTPDERLIRVLKELNQRRPGQIRILTTVSDQGNLFLHQIRDKQAWLAKYCPFLNLQTQFLPAFSNKRNLLSLLFQSDHDILRSQDILIDDYNPNLEQWQKAGGIPIKYCNGINSPKTGTGIKLTADMTDEEILDLLLYMDTYSNFQNPHKETSP